MAKNLYFFELLLSTHFLISLLSMRLVEVEASATVTYLRIWGSVWILPGTYITADSIEVEPLMPGHHEDAWNFPKK